MYPVFSTSLFLLILGTTSFPGTLNFIGELFNMISLSIVDVVFNGLFVTSIPLTTSYSLFLFKRSCGNIYLNYRNQTMDVSRLYLWIPSAALFPLTAMNWVNIMMKAKLTTGGLFVRIDSLRVMKGNILSAPIFRYTVIHNYDHQQHPYSRSSYLIWNVWGYSIHHRYPSHP